MRIKQYVFDHPLATISWVLLAIALTFIGISIDQRDFMPFGLAAAPVIILGWFAAIACEPFNRRYRGR